MPKLTVNIIELKDALQALSPFLAKENGDPNRVERGEFVHCTITSAGCLLLTVYRGECYWALATVALEDFDGEITDFAIHRPNVGVITAAFPRARVGDSLTITVEHYSYESKALQGDEIVTEYKRDTRIRLDEEGQLFGSRSVQFAGIDARSHSAAEMWANAEGILQNASGTEPHFFGPQSTKFFAKAANIYGVMVATYTSDAMIARAKNFVGCAPLPVMPDQYVAPPNTREWVELLASEIPLAPAHTIYSA